MKLITILLFQLILPLTLSAKIKVVTSTSDLAYYAKQIGGEYVEVSNIAPPNSDIHFVEVRPSYMIKVAKADVVFKIGMELDIWMDKLIDGSRNNDLRIIDCSKYVRALEVPTYKADARFGDIHKFGNPHYWLGPQNLNAITDAIVEGLSKEDPKHAGVFEKNQEKFILEVTTAIDGLKSKLKELEGATVIYYHNSWPYFNEFAGITSAEFIEPFPGVPPSPSQIKKLVSLIKESDIKVIAMEPYFDKRIPEKIAIETNARLVTLFPSIGGRDKNETYSDWLNGNITALVEAIK